MSVGVQGDGDDRSRSAFPIGRHRAKTKLVLAPAITDPLSPDQPGLQWDSTECLGRILPLGKTKRCPNRTPFNYRGPPFSSSGETRTPDPGIRSAVL